MGACMPPRDAFVANQPSACSMTASARLRPELPDVPIAGNVWALSRDPQGCRRVQRELEDAKTDHGRAVLAKELHGHVWEAIKCPNANHVLQKCIVNMRPQTSQFIIDEIMEMPGGVVKVARHTYGCRIAQRLLEHSPSTQVKELVENLLEHTVELSMHSFGNFVMQHLLEHGTGAQQ